MRRPRIPESLRALVSARASHCCEYCWSQADFATERFSVEHIIPLIRGGANGAENVALACAGCNGHKYAKIEALDLSTNTLAPLYHPRQQSWGDHFRWSADFTLIIGITPTGRATVEALQMNRPSLINLRSALYRLSAHPPAAFHELG